MAPSAQDKEAAEEAGGGGGGVGNAALGSNPRARKLLANELLDVRWLFRDVLDVCWLASDVFDDLQRFTKYIITRVQVIVMRFSPKIQCVPLTAATRFAAAAARRLVFLVHDAVLARSRLMKRYRLGGANGSSFGGRH